MLRSKPKITITERPAPDAPEHIRASWWRQHVVGMTREGLSGALGGYECDTIWRYESGRVKGGKAWHRYRNACASVHGALPAEAQRPGNFNWGL